MEHARDATRRISRGQHTDRTAAHLNAATSAHTTARHCCTAPAQHTPVCAEHNHDPARGLRECRLERALRAHTENAFANGPRARAGARAAPHLSDAPRVGAVIVPYRAHARRGHIRDRAFRPKLRALDDAAHPDRRVHPAVRRCHGDGRRSGRQLGGTAVLRVMLLVTAIPAAAPAALAPPLLVIRLASRRRLGCATHEASTSQHTAASTHRPPGPRTPHRQPSRAPPPPHAAAGAPPSRPTRAPRSQRVRCRPMRPAGQLRARDSTHTHTHAHHDNAYHGAPRRCG